MTFPYEIMDFNMCK